MPILRGLHFPNAESHFCIETKCALNEEQTSLSNEFLNYHLGSIPRCFMWHRLHKYSLFPCHTQAHDNNSNLVVRTPAKKATALSQQVSVSTEQRESRRATPVRNILPWNNYRSLLGGGRRTFTPPLMEEVSTKSPPPWTSALSTGRDRRKVGAQQPVKCYSLEKTINK